MSIPKRMTVGCSKCGKPLSVTVFESVNSDYADDIAKQIISGDLFNVECPYCEFVSHLEYDVLYHDLRHGALIWVVHKGKADYDQRVSKIRNLNILPYKTTRIVDDMNALKEKVSCLESDRDDRIIELCKLFTACNLLLQQPNFVFRNAFFTTLGGKELVYLYDNDNNVQCCELSEKAYDYLKELYDASDYAAQFEENYPIVDDEWAENILFPLMGAEAKKMDLEDNAESIVELTNDLQRIEKKTCPKCKAMIPGDSEFCQRCGAKLSKPESETPKTKEMTEELLSEIEIMEIKGTHPVILESAFLYCFDDREKYFLRCKFRSLTDKIISALMVDIFCFDVWGNELSTIHDVQILDLSPNRNDVFGFSRKIAIADINTRKVNIKLKRIRFNNGTIEECSGKEIKVPPTISLKKHFNSLKLMNQYIYETTKNASFVPIQLDGFWRCTCGIINVNSENVCDNCGVDKQTAFDALDVEFLERRYSAFIENKHNEDEKIKIANEKQRLIEQRRQEEIESQRIVQIQNKRNLAIEKRMATIDATKKRSKIIKISIISVIVVIIAVLIVTEAINRAHNNELRNFAIEVMNDDYTNVYADVVSIEPMYFVYQYKENKYGTQIGDRQIWDVVCKCKTVEGKTIWISVFHQYYPGGNYSSIEANYKAMTYSSNSPQRITGSVDTAYKVVPELESKIGNIFVLDVRNKITN